MKIEETREFNEAGVKNEIDELNAEIRRIEVEMLGLEELKARRDSLLKEYKEKTGEDFISEAY